MDTKFNIGGFSIKTPGDGDMPEMDLQLNDVVIEVKDLSISEFGSFLKGIIFDARSVGKEFAREHAQSKERLAARQHEHEKSILEMEQKQEQDLERLRNERFKPASSAPPSPDSIVQFST